MRDLRPSQALFSLAREMFVDLWNHKLASASTQARSAQIEFKKLERSVEQLLDRIVAADGSALVEAYEGRIRSLEERKALLRESIAQSSKPEKDFESAFRTTMESLSNPCKLWVSGRIEYQRIVLKLAFVERIAYARGSGFEPP